MTKRNLILIHRGPEYQQDFDEIAFKVNALDKNITVYHLPFDLDAELPKHAWQYPSLTVALAAGFQLQIKRGPVLKNLPIEKLVQQDIFNRASIPTPPALPFRFGMMLDPILFGNFVVLKPMDLDQTSTGNGVHLIRRRRLHEKKWRDFPPTHPIQQAENGYIVQRFVDTGAFPSFYRIQTFLGKAIYAWHSTLIAPRCSLDASDDEIEQTTVASQGGVKSRRLINDPDMIEMAERVHAALPLIPMLAVDCVREANTGKIFVLECNAGGNTWHFSSKIGEKLRMGFGDEKTNGAGKANAIARKMFIDQFGAFDIVADQLTRVTHSMAE